MPDAFRKPCPEHITPAWLRLTASEQKDTNVHRNFCLIAVMTAIPPSIVNDITVSLEDHLRVTLEPLLPILPLELSTVLSAELDGTEIHYSLLSKISRWARTDEGAIVLQGKGLHPGSFLMVALLAGTTTAPSSKPPLPPVRNSAEARAKKEFNDRKALTAVVNGLLSIGCSGGAAWWAADKSGWRDEWVCLNFFYLIELEINNCLKKVLLALFVATVVGFSETILYIIWQSRHSTKAKAVAIHKKTDSDYDNDSLLVDSIDARENDQIVGGQIRRRTGHHVEK